MMYEVAFICVTMYAMLVTIIKANDRVINARLRQSEIDALSKQSNIADAIRNTEAMQPRLEQLEKRVASLSVSKGFGKND